MGVGCHAQGELKHADSVACAEARGASIGDLPMDDQAKSPGSRFTEAARAAGAKARRLKWESSVPKDTPAVFVVRVPPTNRPFSWEIRRYGSFVLQRGVDQFATAAEARVAGETALAAL